MNMHKGRWEISFVSRREEAGTGPDRDHVFAQDPPLLGESAARRLLVGAFIFLALLQLAYLFWIGNGLGKLSDDFSEANALRAAEAYWRDGLTSHHGLPRILYGTRFPDKGGVSNCLDSNGLVKANCRIGFPDSMAQRDNWVYTHYPPGPDLLCGMMTRLIGLDHIWIFRLFPVCLGLMATAIFFRALARAFGVDRGALIAPACAVLPMFSTYMPGLHYQGYSFALLLLQLSLLIRLLWGSVGPRPWHFPFFFLLGFLQGWLSFDQFFVVSLLAVPLWLLRRTEGPTPSVRWLVLMVGLPLTGFALAHFLHFLQVAADLGGLRSALDEFRRTANARTTEAEPALPQMLQGRWFSFLRAEGDRSSYLRSLTLAGYQYLRDFLHPGCLQFFPFLPLAFVAAIPVVVFRSGRLTVMPKGSGRPISFSFAWPGKSGVLPPLLGALLVSSLWWLVMPGHTVGNHHITVRHFFVFYFFLVLTIARSINASQGRFGIPGASGES